VLPVRVNEVHWTWLVYLEMFVAGVAAGAYVLAAILELCGRGRSNVARTAYQLCFPLMVLATVLLIVDLTRPERFWHMVIMSERLLPILKPWSPMSLGSWLLVLFSGFAFVSFVDARFVHRLQGSRLGIVWSLLGGVLALAVATYSGVLLTVTNIPFWAASPAISAVYAATAVATGASAVMLVHALRGQLDSDLLQLARGHAFLVAWWLVTVVVFLALSGGELGGLPLAAVVAALLLGVFPLAMAVLRASRTTYVLAVSSSLVLVAGFLVRSAIVMAPQL
jgi:formate-dependent nitrite reductase membrane component NrfD